MCRARSLRQHFNYGIPGLVSTNSFTLVVGGSHGGTCFFVIFVCAERGFERVFMSIICVRVLWISLTQPVCREHQVVRLCGCAVVGLLSPELALPSLRSCSRYKSRRS